MRIASPPRIFPGLFFGLFFIVSNLATYAQNEKQVTENIIYQHVEQPPAFPGGPDSLMSFLSTNINYPAEYENKNITGTVLASFVISKEGNVENIQLLRGVPGHPLFAEETMRVIMKMPQWTPGKLGDKPVRVQYNLPVRFTPGDKKK